MTGTDHALATLPPSILDTLGRDDLEELAAALDEGARQHLRKMSDAELRRELLHWQVEEQRRAQE